MLSNTNKNYKKWKIQWESLCFKGGKKSVIYLHDDAP